MKRTKGLYIMVCCIGVGIIVLYTVLHNKLLPTTITKTNQTAIPTMATEILPTVSPSSKDNMYYSEILDRDFTLAIQKNPIDQWWLSTPIAEVNAYSMIQAYLEYCTYWESEMQNAVCILQSELNERDYQVLCEAQTSWSEYVEYDFSIKQALYYMNSSYETGDGYTYPMVFAEKAKEVKRRTVELLSYVYTLTGEIEFVFSQDK